MHSLLLSAGMAVLFRSSPGCQRDRLTWQTFSPNSAETDPDGAFIPLFPSEATALVRQAARLDALDGVTMIGGAAILTTEFIALPESEDFYFSAPDLGDGGNTNQATDRSAADVLTAFEVAFGGPPTSPYWAHGYDATTLLLSAIEQASVVDGDTLYVDRAALREALDSTAGFQGIIGTLACDDFGDCGPWPQCDPFARGLQRHGPVTPTHRLQGCSGLAPA